LLPQSLFENSAESASMLSVLTAGIVIVRGLG